MPYDAIIIGGGHNGLTTAAFLAKAGRKVIVLERRPGLGGMAALEEFHPGHKTPGLLHDTTGVRRRVVDALRLEQHGLEWRAEETPVFAPLAGGRGLLLHRAPDPSDAEIRTLSARDSARYGEWRAFLGRIGSFLSRFIDEPAPEIGAKGPGDVWDLMRTGFRLRRLSRTDMLELIRIAPMCVADYLNEWFETKLLKAVLAGPAISGTWLGPWSAGTVVNLLVRECAAGPEVRGGPAALTRALSGACLGNGGEVRTSSTVRRIRISGGRVTGVELSDGERIEAPVVASSCDPRRTFLDLVAPRDLPTRLERPLRLWRVRGTTAKVNLALSGPLEFQARPGTLFETVRIAEELDDLERAFDAVKYGEFSQAPFLEIAVPTVSDPSLAPAGHHVVSILVHFAPYELKGGWTPEKREALGDTVVDRLVRHAPSVKGRIRAREVLTPMDLEERYALTGGHIHHGEHSLDQLFSLRPDSSCARHSTPVKGLFLCGSGSHPGGGITCGPGALAAAAVLSRQ